MGALGHPSDDVTGLIYMQARYYDPAVGRFVIEDPAKDGPNWCVYCCNNPLNQVDPDGKRHLTQDESWWFQIGLMWAANALSWSMFSVFLKLCGFAVTAFVILTLAVVAFIICIGCMAMALGLNDGRGLMFGGGVGGMTGLLEAAAGWHLYEQLQLTEKLGAIGAVGVAAASAVIAWTAGCYAALWMCDQL